MTLYGATVGSDWRTRTGCQPRIRPYARSSRGIMPSRLNIITYWLRSQRQKLVDLSVGHGHNPSISQAHRTHFPFPSRPSPRTAPHRRRDREAVHPAGRGRRGAQARAGQPETLPGVGAQGRVRGPAGAPGSRRRAGGPPAGAHPGRAAREVGGGASGQEVRRAGRAGDGWAAGVAGGVVLGDSGNNSRQTSETRSPTGRLVQTYKTEHYTSTGPA